MTALWVEITATKGSAPRDAGTAMMVTAHDTAGTIGGGALEFEAIAHARAILAGGGNEETRTYPLGPNLGQCCGGSVTLRYTHAPCTTDTFKARTGAEFVRPESPLPLWLWGAGHVGQAVVRAASPDLFAITWIDTAPERFPQAIPGFVTDVPAADMPRLAARAPMDAHHLIFTYAHDIDLALCAALLKRGFASCGLIGSETKYARFSKRLAQAGLDPARITCPIGDKSLGKHPDAIAKGTLTALLRERTLA
ncbi:xanthine dehydrogenase accessory factor [Sulfitobacter brevis]|uniref:Xanthine dehydrogenase accessory factor n=1 Tax=Sulfitobacter brevis TaxID=74348 RepID=A0A1I2FI97_9RHOB|nr:xanthine dehydrogenase accessory protein XdhC [Sulfitobacter brevis]SFF05005.1 xanthine dehydrogenase accessory factor [Sulfitobacter brevis]